MANLDDVELLNEFGKAHPDVFGGLRISGDALTVYFCRDVQENLQAAIDHLAANGRTKRIIRGEHCEHSLRDLMVTANAVSDDIPALNAGGADVRGVSVDIARNRVVVSLGGTNATTAIKLLGAYGQSVVLEHQTAHPFPVSRNRDDPA